MRITTTLGAGAAALLLAFSLSACTSSDDDMMDDSNMSSEMSDSMSEDMSQDMSDDMSDDMDSAMLSGDFMGMNDKMVAGEVTIDGDMLTLSGFSSDEGPDLHLYLANGTDEAAVMDGMELGTVAFDEAEQTFMLDGADASDYTNVVVHCDKAQAVFGAADIN